MKSRRRALLAEKADLKFNQLVQKLLTQTSPKYGIAIELLNDRTYSISGTATSTLLLNLFSNTKPPFVVGNKYLFYEPNTRNIRWGYEAGQCLGYGSFIATNTANSSGASGIMYIYTDTSVDATFSPSIINLTEMYGTGNEPSAVAQVKADCLLLGYDLDNVPPYTPIS